MKRISEFKDTMSLKEMSTIVGGESMWVCTEDTAGGSCGDTRTVTSNDNGNVLSDKEEENKCLEPVTTQAYSIYSGSRDLSVLSLQSQYISRFNTLIS
jgi:hypothetical protein